MRSKQEALALQLRRIQSLASSSPTTTEQNLAFRFLVAPLLDNARMRTSSAPRCCHNRACADPVSSSPSARRAARRPSAARSVSPQDLARIWDAEHVSPPLPPLSRTPTSCKRLES